MRIRLSLRLAAVWAMLILPAIGHAQQEYKLGDDDTWQPQRALEPGTPEAQLEEARRALAEKEFARAENLASAWIKRHERHPLLPEAYLIRGDARVGQYDEYNALFDFEFIARTYPGSEAFVSSLQRELDIARQYADGYKRKLFGLRMVGAEDEAEELFIRVQERLPGSRLAEEAGMELADFYFRRQQMTLAAEAYSLFIENYPKSAQLEKAQRRFIYAQLASFKGPQFDAAGLYEARARLSDLQATQPAEAQRMGADALLAGIDDRDSRKMLETARWYWRVDNPIAAEQTLRKLVKTYPNSAATAEALRLIPDILTRLPQRIRDVAAPMYDAARAASGFNLSHAERTTSTGSPHRDTATP